MQVILGLDLVLKKESRGRSYNNYLTLENLTNYKCNMCSMVVSLGNYRLLDNGDDPLKGTPLQFQVVYSLHLSSKSIIPVTRSPLDNLIPFPTS